MSAAHAHQHALCQIVTGCNKRDCPNAGLDASVVVLVSPLLAMKFLADGCFSAAPVASADY